MSYKEQDLLTLCFFLAKSMLVVDVVGFFSLYKTHVNKGKVDPVPYKTYVVLLIVKSGKSLVIKSM
jgi:hypothetical protein